MVGFQMVAPLHGGIQLAGIAFIRVAVDERVPFACEVLFVSVDRGKRLPRKRSCLYEVLQKSRRRWRLLSLLETWKKAPRAASADPGPKPLGHNARPVHYFALTILVLCSATGRLAPENIFLSAPASM